MIQAIRALLRVVIHGSFITITFYIYIVGKYPPLSIWCKAVLSCPTHRYMTSQPLARCVSLETPAV